LSPSSYSFFGDYVALEPFDFITFALKKRKALREVDRILMKYMSPVMEHQDQNSTFRKLNSHHTQS